MQIPTNNGNPYPQYSYPQQGYVQYPQVYPQQQYQQYPGYQIPQQQYAQQPKPKAVVPAKKPAPFSFEPGSNKELDDALNSIDTMYNDMFDTVDNQKQRQESGQEKEEEYCIGIPIDQKNNGPQIQLNQVPNSFGNIQQDPEKWNYYNGNRNSFY
ncbi:unnamed protein product (macronuclear) [Paramecium tetraurelia]|uniref:Uncharacterized protein n=1 Tax=Paramecium tetraurelia TaxID=5888 RepID=A0DV85_PARTE|nr:uncharacterized protein GSPATT00020616001 [Paramecium tetraurelia]CAK86952.1 unnamed protein product [Paramecium tetraurelia]|eukprot:XP_001454349.1 hypothetical protein (macronuclear) [Paramecium tetraurelia strain d4-2]